MVALIEGNGEFSHSRKRRVFIRLGCSSRVLSMPNHGVLTHSQRAVAVWTSHLSMLPGCLPELKRAVCACVWQVGLATLAQPRGPRARQASSSRP